MCVRWKRTLFSYEGFMDFSLRFTDREITPWGGLSLMKRMLKYLGFVRRSWIGCVVF